MASGKPIATSAMRHEPALELDEDARHDELRLEEHVQEVDRVPRGDPRLLVEPEDHASPATVIFLNTKLVGCRAGAARSPSDVVAVARDRGRCRPRPGTRAVSTVTRMLPGGIERRREGQHDVWSPSITARADYRRPRVSPLSVMTWTVAFDRSVPSGSLSVSPLDARIALLQARAATSVASACRRRCPARRTRWAAVLDWLTLMRPGDGRREHRHGDQHERRREPRTSPGAAVSPSSSASFTPD